MKFNWHLYSPKYNHHSLSSMVYTLCVLLFCLTLAPILFATSLEAQSGGNLYSTDPTSTNWVKSKNAKSRLLNAYLQSDPKNILGGLEITMREKWKTYWRVPGEGGLPPKFDFSGSQNLEKAEIKWPAPNRYVDRFGVAIGYKDRVIFPISIIAKDSKKPVFLKLKVDYAVCEIVCIPLTAIHELSFKIGEKLDGRHLAAIKTFMDLVPRPFSDYKSLKVLNIKAAGKGPKAHIVLDMKSTLGFRQPEIFVEGPEALYFRTPKLDSKPSVVSRWHVPYNGELPEGDLIGKKLKITFIDGKRQVEGEFEVKK